MLTILWLGRIFPIMMTGRFPPDVVLMDVRVPEADGLQATVQIKALWPQVKVIVLSMHLEYRNEALAAGAGAFVGKGEPAERLLAVLSAVVDADLACSSCL